MRRLLENRFLRGMAIIALVSLAIVLLSLEESLVTANALLHDRVLPRRRVLSLRSLARAAV